MMSEEELRALGEDIKKNGLREGVTLLDGKLLDGRNRLDAMEKAGLPVLKGNQLDVGWNSVKGVDPVTFVISKNIHRRHLSAERKRELVAKLIQAAPEKSDRQIAKDTDSNRNTVGRIRTELEQTGDVSLSDTRTDSRGRKQVAHKPTTATTKPTEDTAVVAAADRAEARARKGSESATEKKPPTSDLISCLRLRGPHHRCDETAQRRRVCATVRGLAQ